MVRNRYISQLHLIDFGVAAALASVFVVGAHAAEPLPPAEVSSDEEIGELLEITPDAQFDDADFDTELPTDDGGFYPTIEETMLLGGDYPRSGEGELSNVPPDSLFQTAQGITPYPNPGQGYRAPWAEPLSPLNPFLGFFAPREALIAHSGGDWPQGLSLDLDSSFPILVRDFSPERAMVKAGPTYFDLLFVGTTVLHSDYQGTRTFRSDSEDGWLIGIEFGLRGMVQFTDQFYLSLAATLVYLPLDNEIGIRLGTGGAPTAVADLNYAFEYDSWDIQLYNILYADSGNDLFFGIDQGARERAGRYSFGFDDRDRDYSGYFNGDNGYFTNIVGVDATTQLLQDWRLWLSGKRYDSWRTFDFDKNGGRNSLSALLGYNGSELWFAPAVEYYLDDYDDTDVLYSRLYLSLRGRVSENLSLQARAGYLWRDSNRGSIGEGFLYSLALYHELSRYTSHSVSVGQDYEMDDLTNNRTVASYVRYQLDHAFTRSLTGDASFQYSDQDGIRFEGQRTTIAARLRYAIRNGYNSAIVLRGAYERREGTSEGERWLGRVSYTQSLFTRSAAELFYQYEEATIAPNFNEQLVGFTFRQYF